MSIFLSAWRYAVSYPLFSWGSALALWLMVAGGMFDVQSSAHWLWLLPASLWILGWLAWELYGGIVRYCATDARDDRYHEAWLGLGFALLGGCALMLRLTGGFSSAFYPLMYLAVAFLISFGTAKQGAYWLGYALFLEVAAITASVSTHHAAVGRGALHIVFLGLFAGSHHVYLHGLLWDMRRFRRREQALSDLVSRPSQIFPSAQTPAGLTASSMLSLHSERQALFSFLRQGLDAHGCALLWIDEDEKSYEVFHIESQSDDVELGSFPLQLGTPAMLFQRKHTMSVSRSGEAGIHLPYYGLSVSPRAWLAVPILQGQRVRGALCADRVVSQPFSSRDEALMEAVAILFGRALESQRSFLYSHREPEYLEPLYQAGRQLNQIHSEVELAQSGLDLATRLVSVDWGLLSLYDPDKQTHTIMATTREVDHLIRQTLPVEDSLLALAIKHGCSLPDKGLLRSSVPLLSVQDPDLPEYASAYIMPLWLKDRTLGCLVLASRDPQRFVETECEKKLGILTHHCAALLDNIRQQKLQDQMVDCDALTQVLNHRALLEKLHEPFEQDQKVNKRFSVLAVDIDQFQQINTQYGYTVGDHVLSRVAGVLKAVARDIDTVARFAGDEFVLLLDETSRTQALKVADRLIEQISQLSFPIELPQADDAFSELAAEPIEVFHVSVSIGVATYPDCATHPMNLLLGAEEALLIAKQRGGQRAILFSSPSNGVAQELPPALSQLTQPPPGWGWASSSPLPFYSEEDMSDSSVANEKLMRARSLRPEVKLSVSHILEAVMKDNRNSSKDDLLAVPMLLEAPRKHDDLPDEPPYPHRDSEEPSFVHDQEDESHDSTEFLPKQQEKILSPVENKEPSPLDTPAPQPDKHRDPFHPDLRDLPHIEGEDIDKS